MASSTCRRVAKAINNHVVAPSIRTGLLHCLAADRAHRPPHDSSPSVLTVWVGRHAVVPPTERCPPSLRADQVWYPVVPMSGCSYGCWLRAIGEIAGIRQIEGAVTQRSSRRSGFTEGRRVGGR